MRQPASLTRRALLGTAAASASATLLARPAKAGGPVKLRVMSWEQFQPGEKESWNELFAKYNASQSQAEVSWTGFPFNQFVQNVVTQIHAGGIEADILMATPDLAAQVIRKFDLGVPLDPIVEQLGVQPSGGHEYLRRDGKLYGLSVIDVPFTLIYDRTEYAAAGIARPPTTPDEWVSVTAKLTRRPQQFGMALTNTLADGEQWWIELQNFCLPFDGVWARGKQPMVTSDPVLKGLHLWYDLYQAGVPQGTAAAAMLRLFGDGRIAQTWGVTATMVVVQSVSPKEYSRLLTAAPPWSSRKALDRLHPLIVLKTGKHVELALDFVKFAMQPDNMAALMQKNLYAIPPYDLSARSPAFRQYAATMPWISGFLAAKQVSPVDVMGDFSSIDDQFGRIVVQNMQRALGGGMSIEQAMAAAQQQLAGLAAHI
jgi:ABC-type glycerol-3-phosphate transport system substrate-binding protein